jgi:tRNA A37 methylthiotransferase MiaB
MLTGFPEDISLGCNGRTDNLYNYLDMPLRKTWLYELLKMMRRGTTKEETKKP